LRTHRIAKGLDGNPKTTTPGLKFLHREWSILRWTAAEVSLAQLFCERVRALTKRLRDQREPVNCAGAQRATPAAFGSAIR